MWLGSEARRRWVFYNPYLPVASIRRRLSWYRLKFSVFFIFLSIVMCVRTNITHFSVSAFKRGYKQLHFKNGHLFTKLLFLEEHHLFIQNVNYYLSLRKGCVQGLTPLIWYPEFRSFSHRSHSLGIRRKAETKQHHPKHPIQGSIAHHCFLVAGRAGNLQGFLHHTPHILDAVHITSSGWPVIARAILNDTRIENGGVVLLELYLLRQDKAVCQGS